MIAIVGLGNPGSRYDGTRHNVGFAVIDRLAATWRAEPYRRKHRALQARVTIQGVDCLLCKPETFMNLSGEAVGPMARFYRIAPSELLIVHDELDFPLGRVRIKQGGGHGGHNGLRSLKQHIDGDFARVRIGIGALNARGAQVDFVLGRFAKPEGPVAEQAIEEAAGWAEQVVTLGVAKAMNACNRRETI